MNEHADRDHSERPEPFGNRIDWNPPGRTWHQPGCLLTSGYGGCTCVVTAVEPQSGTSLVSGARSGPDEERLQRYAEAIDPEAFDLHMKRSKHPAAVIQWAARCHIARESARASITVADAEQEALRAEVERVKDYATRAVDAEARAVRQLESEVANLHTESAGWQDAASTANERAAAAEAEVERWRDKAQEAGAAYANANTKHHAEWERANRLERLADTLAGKAVDLEDRARGAEARADRLAETLGKVREVHSTTHWCLAGDSLHDLRDVVTFEPGTRWWPCPMLAILDADPAPEAAE